MTKEEFMKTIKIDDNELKTRIPDCTPKSDSFLKSEVMLVY